MNSQPNLLRRLIRLYPVKLLKDEFNTSGTSDTLYNNIVQNTLPKSITDFAGVNIGLTKQHIYIVELGKDFHINQFKPANFPFKIMLYNAQPL